MSHRDATMEVVRSDRLMTKREREFMTLRFVYDEETLTSVSHVDQPDFRLRLHRDAPEFGVEVTDLFRDEADARKWMWPRYVSDLLDGKPHMHRDDEDALKVTTVKVTDADGNVKYENLPAILRQSSTHIEHLDAIAETIRRKDERRELYAADLTHVNLIIADHFDSARGIAEYSTTEFLSPLRDALLESGFREIYVVSSSPGGELVYRPLRMLLMMEAFYVFLGALWEFPEVVEKLDYSDVAPLFVRIASSAKMPLRFVRERGGSEYALYCAVGARYGEKGLEVLDLHDFTLPESCALPPNRLCEEQLGEIRNRHQRFVATQAFTTEYAAPVRAVPDFGDLDP